MQIPYKVDSLLQYIELLKPENRPDFSDRCLICNEKNCAVYNGTYARHVSDPLSNFYMDYFKILQYRCNRKGKSSVTDHVTFSLLPWMLIPYHRLPLTFMVFAIQLKLRNKLSFDDVVKKIDEMISEKVSDTIDYLTFIRVGAILNLKLIIMIGLNKFLESSFGTNMIKNSLDEIVLSDDKLLSFIDLIENYKSEYNSHPIRGPNAFAWDFYQKFGGTEKNASFLFGTASQH